MLGFILAGTISVAASILYNAKDVGYTPDNENWQVDNVKDAIDFLYDSKKPFKIVNTIGQTNFGTNGTANFSQSINGLTVGKYYLLLTKIGINASATTFAANLTLSDSSCEQVLDTKDFNSIKTTDGYYPGWVVRYYLCKPESTSITVNASLTKSIHGWMYLNAYEIE